LWLIFFVGKLHFGVLAFSRTETTKSHPTKFLKFKVVCK